MTIGLDIDDTMTNSNELIVEYAKRHLNSEDEKLIEELIHPYEIKGKSFEFYNKYSPKMIKNYTLKDNVKEVINRLREKGHKLIVITARGGNVKRGVVAATKKYFEENDLIFDEVIFGARGKIGACLTSNVDIMIDDSISVLENLKEHNIKTLLFTSEVNKSNETTIDRVSSWLELEEYIDKI